MKTPAAYALLAIILAAGAALRFQALSRPSLWDDEMSTYKIVSVSRSAQTRRLRVFDTHPPLYFEQLRLWKLLAGGSLGRLRANSALWGTLSLAAIFFLALKLTASPESALLSAALLCFSPWHLAYSQELRSYAFGVCLGIATFHLLELWLETRERRWLALCLLAMAAELYTHYWHSFTFCAQVLYGLLRLPDWRARRRWLLLSGCAAATFLFWAGILLHQVSIIQDLGGFWALPPGPVNVLRTLSAYMGLYFRFASSDFTLDWPLLAIMAVAAAYALAFARGLKTAPLLARLWLPVGLGLPLLLSYWKPTVYAWYRYPVLMYPPFLIWLAAGLAGLPRRLKLACAGIIFAASAWGCGQYASGWEKANPKAVMAYVNGLAGEGCVVVRPAYFADLFAYYYTGKALVVDEDSLDSADKRAGLKGGDVVLVAFDEPGDPVTKAFLDEFGAPPPRRFPGFARLGLSVYRLRR